MNHSITCLLVERMQGCTVPCAGSVAAALGQTVLDIQVKLGHTVNLNIFRFNKIGPEHPIKSTQMSIVTSISKIPGLLFKDAELVPSR